MLSCLMSHTSYLSPLTPRNFKNTVARLVECIKAHFPTATLVMGRGLSGTMVVPAVAAELGIDWAITRKDKGDNHASYKTEASAWPGQTRAVFVDDLIDTGESFRVTCGGAQEAFTNAMGEPSGSYCFEILGCAVYLVGWSGSAHARFRGNEYPIHEIR